MLDRQQIDAVFFAPYGPNRLRSKPLDTLSFLPRDYVATPEGLAFAVVDFPREEDRLIGYLRYRRHPDGWEKLSSAAAATLLENEFPKYRCYSQQRDTWVQAIPRSQIAHHWSAQMALATLCQIPHCRSAKQQLAKRAACALIAQGIPPTQLGISGSLLLGAENNDSDIDLVCYDEINFSTIRQIFSHPPIPFASLALTDWRASYDRRTPSLSLEQYCWHERRKANKVVLDGTKIDISLVSQTDRQDCGPWVKEGPIEIEADVTCDRYAFHTPALWTIYHPLVSEIISYTATFTGQAQRGDRIAVRGYLESNPAGTTRIIVGQTREAEDAFIYVISTANDSCVGSMS